MMIYLEQQNIFARMLTTYSQGNNSNIFQLDTSECLY